MQASRAPVSRLSRLAHAAYGVVAMLAVVALWGWVVDIPAMRDLGAEAAPMPPAAALGLLLVAGSFLGAREGNRRGSIAAATLAGAIAVLTLVEQRARVPLGMTLEWLAPAA